MRALLVFVSLSLLFLFVCVSAHDVHLNEADYTSTPVGKIHSTCVRHVPSGSSIFERANDILVVQENGSSFTLPHCQPPNGARFFFPRAAPTSSPRLLRGSDEVQAAADPFPSDYEGWTTYAAYQHTADIATFLGDFSVPDHPQRKADVLYTFTGLQNIDWIPIVDPEPEGDFDIIQPVLQYPGGLLGNDWGLRSWYVTLKAGALYSTELTVKAGDVIFGNMTRTGPTSYDIISVIKSTGKATKLSVSNSRLASQPWAYVTLECYGCNGCPTYPVKPCQYTDMVLTAASGAPITPKWIADPKPSKHKQCQESVSILGPSAIDIHFR